MNATPDDNPNPDADALLKPYPESPVPSDKSLFEGELPFTAFGQHGYGNLDLRVFEQDKYWVNIHGEPFLLEEMSDEYLFNVMNHLFTHVEHFHLGMIRRGVITLLFDTLSGKTNPLNPDAEDMDGAWKTADMDPVEWLNSTPLVQRIHKLLDWE